MLFWKTRVAFLASTKQLTSVYTLSFWGTGDTLFCKLGIKLSFACLRCSLYRLHKVQVTPRSAQHMLITLTYLERNFLLPRQ